MRKTRIAVICLEDLDNFLDWITPLEEYYEIKKFIVRSNDDIIKAIGFADVIWCEWANEAAMAVTAYLETTKNKNNKKVIVRLHSYEALADYPKQIKWDYVNHVVYVAEHMQEVMNTYHNEMNVNNRVDNTVVPNAVDVSKIKLNKKSDGKKICSVGAISHKKNPSMILQIFDKLVREFDEDYRLHVAGAYQEARYEIYYNHMLREMNLTGKVVMHGNVTDMNKFYSDKDFFLHTSVHEGHCVSATEAMARGIRPVIHNFYGSEKQYKVDMLFNTVDEAVQLLQRRLLPKLIRQYVIDHKWSLELQTCAFVNIIEAVKAK